MNERTKRTNERNKETNNCYRTSLFALAQKDECDVVVGESTTDTIIKQARHNGGSMGNEYKYCGRETFFYLVEIEIDVIEAGECKGQGQS